jgi:hypothetical protein
VALALHETALLEQAECLDEHFVLERRKPALKFAKATVARPQRSNQGRGPFAPEKRQDPVLLRRHARNVGGRRTCVLNSVAKDNVPRCPYFAVRGS